MFSKNSTTNSTESYYTDIVKIKSCIKSADAIVIGAGAGLSASAGLMYTGKRFTKNFPDFIKKYNLPDMYSAAFHNYESEEEFWAYFSRHIFLNRYEEAQNDTYKTLLSLVNDKNYFVITTNVDHMFQKNGFNKERLFYTQGDYGLFQCSVPCHDKTYDNKELIIKMLNEQKDMKIPSELIPLCPVCGKEMTTNLRKDNAFVEDDGWHKAMHRYENFMHENMNKNIVFLDLGIGYNTPSIIKYPFWQMTYNNKLATYACINLNDCYTPKDIMPQSILIESDIKKAINDLMTF